jgi:uncharacterized membrane protein
MTENNLMIKRFVLYGLAGWCVEIFWTGFGSLLMMDVKLTGRTYIWMFFIYGLAVFLEPVHNRIRNLPVLVRGGVYTVLILSAEYLTGWLLSILIGVCPWDYGTSRYSINGFTRLDFAPAWFAAGLLFEKYHDMLVGLDRVKEPGRG